MSGIYIPGISPPENCDKCTHPTCTLWQNREPDGRHEDCPIIEIGTHGRLIDADALFRTMNEVGWYSNADRNEVALELVLDAKTIITASGGADG